MQEDEFIAQAEREFDSLDEYEKIGQPGRLLAALNAYSLNGCADEESGNVESPTGHFSRTGRWILVTDDRGMHSVQTYDDVIAAEHAFRHMDEEYCQWAGDDE